MLYLHKKGVSTVLSVILVLLITLVIAGVAFNRITSTQRRAEAGISEQQEDLERGISTQLQVLSSDYSTTTNLLQILVTNSGGVSVPTPAALSQFALRYLNGSIVCSTNMSLLSSQAGAAMPTSVNPATTGNITLDLNSGACYGKVSEAPATRYKFEVFLPGGGGFTDSFDIPAA